MTYFADLEPFAIRAHNEAVLKEVSKLRLEERLQDNRQPRSDRADASIFKRLMLLARWGRPAA